MDVPKEHIDGLQLLTELPDKVFKTIMKRAILDGTDPSKREHVSSLLVKCPEVAADTVRRAHAALLAVFLEYVRLSGAADAGPERLRPPLERAGWPAGRQAALLQEAEQARPVAHRLLAGLGHGPARLVDVRWKEVATLQSSLAGAVRQPQFELTLVTLAPAADAPEEVTLSCSREQLQETVASLRRAVRTLETIADGSAAPPQP